MKYLIWTPALRETINDAHKIESDSTMLAAAKKYVESINYPDSFCSIVIAECNDKWELQHTLHMNFQLIKSANLHSMFEVL